MGVLHTVRRVEESGLVHKLQSGFLASIQNADQLRSICMELTLLKPSSKDYTAKILGIDYSLQNNDLG